MFLYYLTCCKKAIECSVSLVFYPFFSTFLVNLIIHEHSCKVPDLSHMQAGKAQISLPSLTRTTVSCRHKEGIYMKAEAKIQASITTRCMHAENVTFRVPTSSGNHRKPGKSPKKKVPCMEKSWNLKNLNIHGKIMEFCEII